MGRRSAGGISPGGEGGGERRHGAQGDPRAQSSHSRRHRIGAAGTRPHPDHWHPAAPSAERRSCSAASSARSRGRPACKAGGAGSPEPTSPKQARARARETIVAPLARRGPCPSPCPPPRSYLWVPAAAERAPTSRERGPYASGRWGAGSRDAQNRSLTPRPARRDLGGGVLSVPGLSFPLPKVCARACVCVCRGAGRTGAAPVNDVTQARASGGRWRPRDRRSG